MIVTHNLHCELHLMSLQLNCHYATILKVAGSIPNYVIGISL